ncbi:MAG: hypothetical protein LBC02_06300 [Planctomycetaceae bacterium]|nr:hypothetical protein [Planctomycetaceae bacterium]
MFTFFVSVCGCGDGKILITGSVTYEDDGAPIESGAINFQTDQVLYSGTIKNGKYKTGGINEVQGVQAGTYKIWFSNIAHIEKNDPTTVDDDVVTSRILSEYGSYSTTPLIFEVKPDGPKTFDIKLKRNPNLR